MEKTVGGQKYGAYFFVPGLFLCDVPKESPLAQRESFSMEDIYAYPQFVPPAK